MKKAKRVSMERLLSDYRNLVNDKKSNVEGMIIIAVGKESGDCLMSNVGLSKEILFDVLSGAQASLEQPK